MSRPLVSVQSPSGNFKSSVPLPHVMLSPIRTDIVNDVHTKINKNHRQPYARSSIAGEDTSAVSWGTGRAVSRIPRVSGGGTNRSGQGAFGNMCRGGRVFGVQKVWRRWNIKVSSDQKRYATCSALAASAVAPLLMARGHRISSIAEVPLVVANQEIDGLTKTKDAIKLLESLGVGPELKKVISSKHIRPGKGKARNRRYIQKLGPLIVVAPKNAATVAQAFRNIPGVEIANVTRLNLLRLAPGGHVGRFIIWSEDAFRALDDTFGSLNENAKQKNSYRPPRAVIENTDISRIIASKEVATRIRAPRRTPFQQKRKNPLTNVIAMNKLNPYAAIVRRRTQKLREIQSKRQAKVHQKRTKPKYSRKEFLKVLHTPSIAPARSAAEIGILATGEDK